jgi:hypothetical protein
LKDALPPFPVRLFLELLLLAACVLALYRAGGCYIVEADTHRDDIPPNLLSVKDISCRAYDRQYDLVDYKHGQDVKVPVITYKADLTVTYDDGSIWKPDGKHVPSFEFPSMARAGTYCVTWNERIRKAILEAQKKKLKEKP